MTNRQDDSGALRERLATLLEEADGSQRFKDVAAAFLGAHGTTILAALSPQGSEPAGVAYSPIDAPMDGDEDAARRYIRDWCPDHVKAYIHRLATPAPAQQADPVQWLRDNYDAYPNIAALCDAMRAALNTTAQGASDA